MKLTEMTLTARISELGTYTVVLHAQDSVRSNEMPRYHRYRFELPVGHRPILEDVRTILQMVAEELQR